jgi:hypothetical protein
MRLRAGNDSNLIKTFFGNNIIDFFLFIKQKVFFLNLVIHFDNMLEMEKIISLRNLSKYLNIFCVNKFKL